MANSQREDIIKNKENQVRILNIIRKMTLDLVKEFYTRFGRIKEYYG
jgi:antitoxin component HigA of HigAB toxin-antitoxin module